MSGVIQPSRGHFERRRWVPERDLGAGRRHRRTQLIECFVPDSIAGWDPPLTATIAATLSEADAAIRDLNEEVPHLASLEALSRQLLRQESVGSSRIEGLVMGQRRLARAAAGVGGDDTARQIVGNVRAMEAAIVLSSEPRDFELDDLLEIHLRLLHSTRDERLVGVIRDEQNWVGGSAFSPAGAEYIPPPPERVDELLEDLIAFVNRDDLPVAMQAAIAHAQFETIHPFIDGNGRVGRCLIHVICRRRGLATAVVPPISLVLATRAKEYVGGLSEYRFAEMTEWLVFFAVATISATRKARGLAAQVEGLYDQWLGRLGNPRADASSRRIASQLPAEPIITIARAAEIAKVSTTAAERAIQALQTAGILKPLGSKRWGRTWETPDVFTLLDRFERELATPDGGELPIRPSPRAN